MAKDKAASELLAAAQAFDEELADFARLADTACRAPLNSQKNLQRAAHVFEDIGRAEKRLGQAAQTLVNELSVARKTQEDKTEAIKGRAREIEERTAVATELLQRYGVIGDLAGELNGFVQGLAKKQTNGSADSHEVLLAAIRDVRSRMAEVGEKAAQLIADARSSDFDDIARQVDALRQQVMSAEEKLGGLERLLAPG